MNSQVKKGKMNVPLTAFAVLCPHAEAKGLICSPYLAPGCPLDQALNVSGKRHVDFVTVQGTAHLTAARSRSGQSAKLQRESTASITPEALPFHLHLGGSIKLHLYQSYLTLWFKREEREKGREKKKEACRCHTCFLLKSLTVD